MATPLHNLFRRPHRQASCVILVSSREGDVITVIRCTSILGGRSTTVLKMYVSLLTPLSWPRGLCLNMSAVQHCSCAACMGLAKKVRLSSDNDTPMLSQTGVIISPTSKHLITSLCAVLHLSVCMYSKLWYMIHLFRACLPCSINHWNHGK